LGPRLTCSLVTRSGNRRWLLAWMITVAAALVFSVLLGDAVGGTGRRPLADCGPKLDFEHPEQFRAFRLYALGCGWRGHPLSNVEYTNVPIGWPPHRRRRLTSVEFRYGSRPERGGSYPLGILIWPACQQNRARITLPGEDTTVRGVPAAWYAGRGQLVLYSGKETVILFRGAGVSAGQLRQAAEALAGVNNSVGSGQPLPEPVPGALAGRLRC
jgi:hypothetical protein